MLWLPGLLSLAPLTPQQATVDPHLRQRLTGKSGSVSSGVTAPFLWVLVHTRFCCDLKESFSLGVLSPFARLQGRKSVVGVLELLQQCKNFGKTVLQFVGRLLGGSIVGLMATSSKRTDATHHAQVCCSQNTCPPGRPQLTRASTGDSQTDKCRPGSVSCGSHCFFPSVLVHTRCCLCPSKVSVGL